MRFLAVDYGTVRIGLAVSDALGVIAQSLPFVSATDAEKAAEEIAGICAERQVDGIVVGLPLRTDGKEGDAAQGARRLGARIAAATALPVEFFDERLTTKLATRVLQEGKASRRRRKAAVDSLAAVILLQGYLEKKGTTAESRIQRESAFAQPSLAESGTS